MIRIGIGIGVLMLCGALLYRRHEAEAGTRPQEAAALSSKEAFLPRFVAPALSSSDSQPESEVPAERSDVPPDEEQAFQLAQRPDSRGEARAMFRQLMAASPDDPLYIGMFRDLSLGELEQQEAAEVLIAEARRCNECVDLQLTAADLLVAIGRTQDAREFLETAVRGAVDEGHARLLSAIHDKLGDRDLAVGWLDRAVDIAGVRPSEQWQKIDLVRRERLGSVRTNIPRE